MLLVPIRSRVNMSVHYVFLPNSVKGNGPGPNLKPESAMASSFNPFPNDKF